ncbi:carboxymuconolactone decarboxylase family protein [Brevibacterium sp. CFH 10365]|uniref:carboxymuconolactone decarboxylase family protein n=1 Tax=Brevibacterium sp. CFH 10365 TaxID=2585207 RepID=UPI00126662C0|nr:carboxymuconolactone decarboxylase family protein [Brevibacterium sp. CFH 10365]
MSNHYHDPDDRKFMRKLRANAPDAFAGFLSLDEGALRAESKAVPAKYTELIALGVALTTQCAYCIESHVKAAKKAGADEQEVAETVFTAAALRAGGAVTHGFLAMKFFEEEN